MPAVMLLLHTVAGTLKFGGSDSSIVFDNSAKLTASCATPDDSAATPLPHHHHL